MTKAELAKRVNEIIAVGHDDERAHSEEDSLYAELLAEYLPADLLKEVVRLRQADFRRWCA